MPVSEEIREPDRADILELILSVQTKIDQIRYVYDTLETYHRIEQREHGNRPPRRAEE